MSFIRPITASFPSMKACPLRLNGTTTRPFVPNLFHARSITGLGSHQITQLQPGLVVIKRSISPEVQTKLALHLLERGEHPDTGFWKTNDKGEKVLNSAPYRGRIYDRLTHLPSLFTDVFQRAVLEASTIDKTLKPTLPTHVIILRYQSLALPPSSGMIPWHRDNGENDGEGDHPVVSINLGDTSEFLINNDKPHVTRDYPVSYPQNLAHRIRFESGDAVVFGGPSRFIWHSISKIWPWTAPNFFPLKNVRFNLTGRYTPDLIGLESKFSRMEKNLPKNNRFFNLEDPKTVK